jgi:hypothetical protein
MQTRRGFLLASLAPLAFPAAAHAAEPRCIADPKRGGELCKTFVDVRMGYQETFHARREPAAVWIGCVAVVFATYGHVVQQPRIAAEAYGGVDSVPLDSGFASVTAPLQRAWTDDDGLGFRATATALFDMDVAAPFDEGALIEAISAGDPVILGGGTHPVVLSALAYEKTGTANRLLAGFVFDPTPMVGPRALDTGEIIPRKTGGNLRFAARLRLERT